MRTGELEDGSDNLCTRKVTGEKQLAILLKSAQEGTEHDLLYHDGEDDGEEGGFEDPEYGQADDLQEGEEMDPPERHVAQVGKVRLVLRWHQEQLDPVPELLEKEKKEL